MENEWEERVVNVVVEDDEYPNVWRGDGDGNTRPAWLKRVDVKKFFGRELPRGAEAQLVLRWPKPKRKQVGWRRSGVMREGKDCDPDQRIFLPGSSSVVQFRNAMASEPVEIALPLYEDELREDLRRESEDSDG